MATGSVVFRPDAKFDTVVKLDAAEIVPQVTWGTSPEMVPWAPACPTPTAESRRQQARRHRTPDLYGFQPGKAITDIKVDRVYRLLHQQPHRRHARSGRRGENLGKTKAASNVKLAMVVPGSGLRSKNRPKRGPGPDLHLAAGFEWREPGAACAWP